MYAMGVFFPIGFRVVLGTPSSERRFWLWGPPSERRIEWDYVFTMARHKCHCYRGQPTYLSLLPDLRHGEFEGGAVLQVL